VTFRLSHLAALLALTMVATTVIGIGATWRVAGEELRDVLDDDIESQARLLARLLAAGEPRLPPDELGRLLRRAFRPDEEDTLWVNVYDSASGRLASNLAHDLPLGSGEQSGPVRRVLGGYGWEGYQYRAGGLVVQVLRREDRIADVQSDIVEEITMPAVLGSAVTLVLLAMLIGLSLVPLGRLVREIEERSADSLAPLRTAAPATEIAILRNTVNRLMAGVDAVLRRERQFASDVAHELRTPLTTLKLELAGPAPDTAVLRAEAERLARLVEQLLLLARLDRARWRSGFGPVKIDALCRREIERFDARMTQADISLSGELSPVEVTGDATLLQALLRNLLTNVLDHCPPGSRATLYVAAQQGAALLEVRDNGPGIPADQLAAMNRDFERLDSKGAGLGLGLAICRRIAKAHDATLEFLSNEGGGLTARVRFPS
jgi:signal transduction histidine kinase